MITQIVSQMIEAAKNLQEAIKLDIEDVKNANHAQLLERNDYKITLIDTISQSQQQLNEELAKELSQGKDIEVYKDIIDKLEIELKKLYELNGRLASIVLPVKQMYSDIISEIEKQTGGHILEISC
jgi:hypothetical protein